LLFSICIPTYNNENSIRDTIVSCMNQNTSLEYEILIVDNASTDNTSNLIIEMKQNCTKIASLTNPNNVNMWANHNMCIKNAKGEYVIFCHADDTLHSNALESINEYLSRRKYPEKYVIWGHSMFNDFKENLDKNNWKIENRIVGAEAYKLFVNGGLVPSGTCFSKKSFIDIGGFIEDDQMIFPNSDSMTMLKLAFDGFSFEMMDDIIFDRRQSSSNHLNYKDKYEQRKSFEYMQNLLLNNFSDEMLFKVLFSSCDQKSNFCYAYYLSGVKKYRKKITKQCLKVFLKNPLVIRKQYFKRIIRRYLIGY
jgi:glycosyltransferase involved in cell wall biosynthesis